MAVQPAPRYTAGAAGGGRNGESSKKLGRANNSRDRGPGPTRQGSGGPATASEEAKGVPEPEPSPLSKKVRHFDRYSRMGGRWSWKRPSYERDVVSLVKAERKMEEGIAAALTEVEAVEAGLKYFDEIIMPQSKRKSDSADTCGDVSGRGRPPHSVQQEKTRSGRNLADHKVKRQGLNGRDGGSHCVSTSTTSQSSSAGRRSGSGDDAIARCVDLKLTLKQRLDNYDRLRGINTQPDNRASISPATHNGNGHKTRKTNKISAKSKQTTEKPFPTPEVVGMGALAPCEGGGLDGESVRHILERSLGNAIAAVRKKASNANGVVGDNGNSRARFGVLPWQPLQERPAAASATERTVKRLEKVGDRGQKRPEVVAKMPLSEDRATYLGNNKPVGITSDGESTNHPATKKHQGEAASDSGRAKAVALNGEARPPASSYSHRSGAPLVPRVATLAVVNNSTEKINDIDARASVRKTKDFDPDKLECVRRHEASVAEKARQVQSLRTEAENKSLFRARPLPAFLGAIPCRYGDGKGAGKGNSGRELAVGVARGTRVELLAALEQDQEARELVEKIRKVNPSADIASMVLRSRVSSTLPLSRQGIGGACSRPSSRDKSLPSTATPTNSTRSTLQPHLPQQPPPPPPQQRAGKDGGADARVENEPQVAVEGFREEKEETAGRHTILEEIDGDCRPDGIPRSLMGRMLGSGMLDRQREWAKERCRKVLESRRKAEEAKDKAGKADILEAGFSERSWVTAKIQHLRSLERQTAEEETREQLREARRRASAVRAQRERESAERQAAAMAVTLAAADEIGRESRTAPNSRSGARKSRRPLPPRRARSHAGDSSTDTAGRKLSLAGGAGAARLRSSEPTPPNETAAEMERLSEDDFFRVAVEAIVERERLSGGGSGAGTMDDIDVDDNDPKAPHLNGKSSDNSMRTKQRAQNTKHFGGPSSGQIPHTLKARRRISNKGGVEGIRRRRGPSTGGGSKALAAPRYPRNGANNTQGAYFLTSAARRTSLTADPLALSEATITTEQGLYNRQGGCHGTSLFSSREVGRTSSLLSLYEAQSVEQIAGGRNSVFDGSVADTLPGASATEDWQGMQSDDGGGLCSGDGDARQDRQVTQVVGIAKENFSWSEERWERSRRSERRPDPDAEHADIIENRDTSEASGRGTYKGSGTDENIPTKPNVELDINGNERKHVWQQHLPYQRQRTGNHIVRDIDPGGGTAVTHLCNTKTPTATQGDECDARWNDILTGRTHNTGDHRIRQRPLSPPTAERLATTGACHQEQPTQPENNFRASGTTTFTNAVSLDDYSELRQPSPRKRHSSERRENVPILPTPATATTEHLLGAAGSKVAGAHAEGVLNNRRGFTLWSSSDDDGSATEIGNSHGRQERMTNEFQPGMEAAALEAEGEKDFLCARNHGIEGEMPKSVPQLREPFFDPATSSADKGRFKVRNPRLFNPTSMRRRPDIVKPHIGERGSVGTANSTTVGKDGAVVTSGVTLLLGRRADGGSPEGEHVGEEQVITVMFDRSKFNEVEARRWWALHRVRIVGNQ